MADNEIKSRLTLEGESEYKKALADASRQLKLLKSDLKATTAEMGRQASSEDKAAVKAASLKKQIAEQEKIVATLTKALADSRTEYADNEAVQAKWEERLNRARTTLAEMRNALEDATKPLEDLNDAMKDTEQGTGQTVSAVISLNDVLKDIGGIAGGIGSTLESIFTSSVDTMKSMVSEMYGLMSEAWAAAGEWSEIQVQWGGSLDSIQQIFTGAKLVGVGSGDLTATLSKLISQTQSGNKSTAAALKELHVSFDKSGNSWDYFTDTMQALSTRQGADRQRLLQAVFGAEGAPKAAILVDKWNDLNSAYMMDVKSTGAEMSEETIGQLNDVKSAIEELSALWDTFRANVGAELVAKLGVQGITDDALDLLRDLMLFFNSEGDKKHEAQISLTEDITSLLTRLSESFANLGTMLTESGAELAESDNSFVAFIGHAMESLGKLFDWINSNWDRLSALLDSLLPAMTANAAVKAVTGKGIGDIAGDVGGAVAKVFEFSWLKKAMNGKASGAAGEAAGTAADAAGAAGGSNFLPTAMKWIATAIEKASPYALAAAAGSASKTGLLFSDITERREEGKKSFDEFMASDMYRQMMQQQAAKNEFFKWEGFPTDDAFSYKQNTTSEMEAAAQAWWDAYKADPYSDDTDTAYEALIAAYEDRGDEFESLATQIQALINSEDRPEDLPSEWFPKLEAALRNLTADAYKPGDITNEVTVENHVQVSTPVYLDGSLIANYVSNSIANNMNGRIFGR